MIVKQTKSNKTCLGKIFSFFLMTALVFFVMSAPSHAAGKYEGALKPVETPTKECESTCGDGCSECSTSIIENTEKLRLETSEEFRKHRDWMIDIFFTEHIRYAMSLMTNQLTAVMLQQVKMIGGFFDAKHQLETQRLFQTLMAQAHSDYQPSEGMCDIGTTTRGLIISERKTDLVKQALSNRVMARQIRSGENLAVINDSDRWSRIYSFKENFCSARDNRGEMATLCITGSAPRINRNKDVDYTRTVDSNLTLNIGFAIDDKVQNDDGKLGNNLTADEKAAFALMANLFAHEPLKVISSRILADGYGNPRSAALRYLSLRSIAAKRSVATNSMSSIIAERSSGNADNGIIPAIEYAPFVKSAVVELGIPEKEIDFILGKNPSYFAQMEVLTKKLYQNPVFYTELYDKPVNVLRKGAAIRAIGLMQDRDFYKSLLRTEAVLAVSLEAMLADEHESAFADLVNLQDGGVSLTP